MPIERIKILAIDPGAREVGVAVLDDEALLYYGVKTLRKGRGGTDVSDQVQRIIEGLFERYAPQYLAITRDQLRRQSGRPLVSRMIKTLANAVGLRVFEYGSEHARSLICDTDRATKRQAARILAQRYSELGQYLEDQSNWRAIYYAKMFEALAVGIICYQEIIENKLT
jgi:Holliday junction resolvasome RuvABC endonuclease subunit